MPEKLFHLDHGAVKKIKELWDQNRNNDWPYVQKIFETEDSLTFANIDEFWENWTESRNGTTQFLIDLCKEISHVNILQVLCLFYRLDISSMGEFTLLVKLTP